MAPLELEGDTLGKKHQFYNKLVVEALKNKELLESSEISNEDDVRNLLKIDVASKSRNVDYIMAILKSEDQLYVSKAIKRSTWLITDPQYAHIINPEYLHTQLYLHVTSRAFNKLMLNIRLHLKDEKRVEAFYNYIKVKNPEAAYKWLQHCSVPFVENEVAKHCDDIPKSLVLRLFEKSITIFEVYTRKTSFGYSYRVMREAEFLAIKHTEKFLDILESLEHGFHFNFGAKSTKALMTKCPQRILDKFEIYGKTLNLATFAKHLKTRDNIKDFLLKQAKNEKFQWLFAYDKIQHFIKHLPKESRFEFVKKVFIDKDIFEKRDEMQEDCCFQYQCAMSYKQSSFNTSQNTNLYQWYKFAPFDVAFTDLKRLIRAESAPPVRNAILQVLLICAGRNTQHIQAVLQYYHDKHINEPFKFKIQFVNIFISRVDTHTLDDETWNLLNQIFHSMEVYIQSDNNVQSCVKSIIVRNAIRKEEIPEVVKNKFVFDTLKNIQRKLKKQEEKDAVFKFLRDYITTKINRLNLSVEPEFVEAVKLCENLLNLLKDWENELHDHLYALDKVKELIKIRNEKSWETNLSSLYNIKSSWRKTMFEESFALCPNEEVCVNALKHDPDLLSRNKDKVIAMCFKEAITPRQLLSKIRIYWPSSLAEDLKTAYLVRLKQPGGHKALVVGLCSLLPQKNIMELLNKYQPSEFKIDWKETDQLELSLRKQIATNIHIARPLPPLEGILLYAKGDYLQYAVPSLNAILSQLSPNKCRQYIPKLLDAPVSLQKFGVRCAFHKLNSQELKPMFTEIWNNTKNSSIRTVLFTHTFALLCKEKNTTHINDTWQLLSMFIDNLNADENKQIFQKLGDVSSVPESIRPQFYMKSYTFLKSLPAKCNCESILRRMQYKATSIMEFFDDDFVVNVMLKDFNETFIKERQIYDEMSIVASFITSSKDEEMEIRRYKILLAPLLEMFLPEWDNVYDEEYRVKNHIKGILEKIVENMETYTFEKKMHIPTKAIENILLKLEKSLSIQKNYTFLTTWKLVAAFVKLLNENKHVITNSKRESEDKSMTDEEKDKMYDETHNTISPKFAKICVQYLKEDLNRFGPSVYLLFSKSLEKLFSAYITRSMCNFEHRMEYAKCLLQYQNEKEVCLVVSQFLSSDISNYYSDSEKNKLEEIRKILFLNPSDEIKMHFYEMFSDTPERKVEK